MKALIAGANGQLGRCLQAVAPAGMQVIACGSPELDICNRSAVDRMLDDERPELVINAAAYTAVDRAEHEEDRALTVNGHGVVNLGEASNRLGARFIHVSTDFVFDGRAGHPYRTDAETNPLGAYGRTKLAGEHAASKIGNALVVRTAWVYAPSGGNFVRTMLRLMSERPEVRVVADQVGTPTYAPALAAALWALGSKGETGIHHYTDAGVASWYDFAIAIQEEALAFGLLAEAVPIIPIATVDFPTPAQRPNYSVLDKTLTYNALGSIAPHWRVNLRKMLNEIKIHG